MIVLVNAARAHTAGYRKLTCLHIYVHVCCARQVVGWATRELAAKLGGSALPTVYTHPGQYAYWNASLISAGGGQRLTCRDIGRLGQLLLNRGRWPAAPTTPAGTSTSIGAASARGKGGAGAEAEVEEAETLYSEDYAVQMVRPSFPVTTIPCISCIYPTIITNFQRPLPPPASRRRHHHPPPPTHQHWGTTYGFLTWLNRPGAAPAFCCAPRW